MGREDEDGAVVVDELAEVRRRAAALDRYIDLIPARFYLGSEEAGRSKRGLDPAKAKPTSVLVMEAALASASPSSGSAAKRRKPNGTADGEEGKPISVANSRAELHEKLMLRIAEMKEERRKRQSLADKAKAAEVREARAEEGYSPKPPKGEGPTSPGGAASSSGGVKRQAPGKIAVDGSELETGRLHFNPKAADIPYEATVGKRGQKVKQLQRDLRKSQAFAEKVQKAATHGEEEGAELRKDLALKKALQRARGEKVHDDPQKLRKTQKALEMKKKKGKDKWQERIESEKQAVKEQQQQRKENLAKRVAGKKKNKKGRSGFEGTRSGFLNSEK